MVSMWNPTRYRQIFPDERAVVPIRATGVMKSLSRLWKRSRSSSQMVRLRSLHCEPKSGTAICVPQKWLDAFSSHLPPFVRFLSCAHG